MKEISIEKLFDLYLHTLEMCGEYLLNEDDDTIKYNVFEEFDIGAHSFLHSENLMKLYQGNFISQDKMNKSILLRKKVMDLQGSGKWKLEYVRTLDEWKHVLKMCDELRSSN